MNEYESFLRSWIWGERSTPRLTSFEEFYLSYLMSFIISIWMLSALGAFPGFMSSNMYFIIVDWLFVS